MKNFEKEEAKVAEQFPQFSTSNGWKVTHSTDIISELSASTLTIVNELEKEEAKEHYFPETGAHMIKSKFVRRSTAPEGYIYVQVSKGEHKHLLMLKK
jgi:hypothetical protein